MMNEWWLAETAASFWELAGPDCQADFETAVLFSLPLSLEWLPELGLHKAVGWLAQRGLPTADLGRLPDRPLRACLVAYRPDCSFVLLDASDAPVEQTFSLAHEVAHYLLDCVQPRQQARQISATVSQVLDRQRPPTIAERIEAALQGIRLQPHFHFMERDTQGDIQNAAVLRAEDRADRLALELLAPQETALALVKSAITGITGYPARLEAAQAALLAHFSLPVPVARPYAAQLVKLAGGQATFMEWLQS
jgi:hypothetical protein